MQLKLYRRWAENRNNSTYETTKKHDYVINNVAHKNNIIIIILIINFKHALLKLTLSFILLAFKIHFTFNYLQRKKFYHKLYIFQKHFCHFSVFLNKISLDNFEQKI